MKRIKFIFLFSFLLPFTAIQSQNLQLAIRYFKEKKFQPAAQEFEKVIPLAKEKLGANDTSKYSKILIYAAESYSYIKNYDKAIEYLTECNKIYESHNATQNLYYAISCSDMARILVAKAKPINDKSKKKEIYYQAAKYYEQSIEVRKILQGPKHNDYINNCTFLAELYMVLNEWDKALPLFLEAKETIGKLYGTNIQGYAKICNGLATIYKTKADTDKWISNLEEVKAVAISLYGTEHHEYAAVLSNLAQAYQAKGDYQKTEELFAKAVSIIEKRFGDVHPFYLTNKLQLGMLYIAKGDFKKAKELLQETKIKAAISIGKKNLIYINSCRYLANLYNKMGNYEKAKDLFLEAHTLIKELDGTESFEYASISNSLANFYFEQAGYQKSREQAKALMKKAADLYLVTKNTYKKILGEKHPEYATICNNIGRFYAAIGQYRNAELIYREAKKILERTTGKEQNGYVTLLSNMANNYVRLKDFAQADEYYEDALLLFEKLFGKYHPTYVRISNDYSMSLMFRADKSKDNTEKEKYYQRAEKLLLEANKISLVNANRSEKFLNEEEREKYLSSKINIEFDVYHSFFLEKRAQNEKLVGQVYDNALTIKGQLLKSNIAFKKSILSSGNAELIKTFNEMNDLAKQISHEYTLPISKQREDLVVIEHQYKDLEAKIKKNATKLSVNKFSNTKTNWLDIKKSLGGNEAAVEIVKFRHVSGAKFSDSIFYFALILRKEFKHPKAVFLFEEQQLEGLIKRSAYENDFDYVKKLYSNTAEAKRLYSLVFRPLKAHLQNTNTIYLSETGLLNKIAFDALVCDDGGILSDNFNIFYVSSSAECVSNEKLKAKNVKKAALFGGIGYNTSFTEMLETVKKMNYTPSVQVPIAQFRHQIAQSRSLDSLSRGVAWSYLPGTLEEAKEIKMVLDKNGVNTNLYSNELACEEQFGTFEPASPEIIHIATHGFYFGDDEKSKEYKEMVDKEVKFAHSSKPLLRSGFMLSGGNHAFQGKELPKGIEDGVLTALEVSNLNLFNTKLAVLSACQTGLGDVKGNEGVYGLQRAFKMAGVDYLLFSLWEVPDEQTKELMTTFYQNWFSGMEIREAFKKAQTQLKTKYAKMEGAAFAWAAFVLMK